MLLEKDKNFIHEVYGTQDENSLLHIAVQSDNFYAIQKIISMGSEINSVDIFGCTPLHYACDDDDIEVVELLINNGADIFIKDNEGLSAIHWAVMGGSSIIFDYLVELGCNPSETANDMRTVIHIAMVAYRKDKIGLSMIRHILEKNNDLINTQDEYGDTALHDIADCDDVGIIDLLLEYGANKEILNNSQETPYSIAIEASCRRKVLSRLI
jgi:ankyrin repeat protein